MHAYLHGCMACCSGYSIGHSIKHLTGHSMAYCSTRSHQWRASLPTPDCAAARSDAAAHTRATRNGMRRRSTLPGCSRCCTAATGTPPVQPSRTVLPQLAKRAGRPCLHASLNLSGAIADAALLGSDPTRGNAARRRRNLTTTQLSHNQKDPSLPKPQAIHQL